MYNIAKGLAVCIAFFTMNAVAQTVTGSGTSGTVPVFTGTSTVASSPIEVSGSNVGIAMTPSAYYLTTPSFLINSPYDNVVVAQGGGTNHELIGTYYGWSPNQVVIAGYNSTNTSGSGASQTTKVVVGGAGSSLPLEVTGTLMVDGTGWPTGSGCCSGVSPASGMAMQVNGNSAITGSVGIGTTTPGATLEVNGTVKIDTTGSNGLTFSGASGTQTTPWTGVLCGGDYAEAVNAKGSLKTYEPGDVLVIGDSTDGEVQKSAEPYSTMVAGIFATKPGVIGRRQSLLKDAEEIPMAMIGIVPTKVTTENGPIHRGDLLVTSSTSGYAMKGIDRSRLVGAVIGKAMGSLDSGTGEIEVLVTLQ